MRELRFRIGLPRATMAALLLSGMVWSEDFLKPYSPPCTERENVFEFTEKPAAKKVSPDKYEITFAVKGYCDVTVGIMDPAKDLTGWGHGTVVRHLASGVLGPNAPAPLAKNSLKQTLYWNGKDDLDEYVKEPGKMRVRVMLGLKPVFDKRLGGSSPYNLPGEPWGLAVSEDGAYVVSGGGEGFSHGTVRKFDREGHYVSTIFPPPASMPLEKSAGMGFIEYEPGKRVRHGRDVQYSIASDGGLMPGVDGVPVPRYCQVAVTGNRLLYAGLKPGALRYIYTDGSTDVKGQEGMPFPSVSGLAYPCPLLAVSPDGKWIYSVVVNHEPLGHVVVRASAHGDGPPTMFIGTAAKPGSEEGQFNGPAGIDCDAQGRIYVSDSRNNRIQVFSPDGKYLKEIPVSGPGLVRVHQKTGAVYVQHSGRVEGKSLVRLTKFASLDHPAEEFHVDEVGGQHMALDSWSPQPRLWLAGDPPSFEPRGDRDKERQGVRIYEEDGRTLRLFFSFDAEARKEAGVGYFGRWGGNIYDKVWCDPVREQVYYHSRHVFDLTTGRLLGVYPSPCAYDDAAFDKRGYMHLHFNPCFFGQGVGRVAPFRATTDAKAEKRAGPTAGNGAGAKAFRYPEVPYDYGVNALGWIGILPTKDQAGAKGFQDGLGVNMRGDVASECNIYYVPKWEDEVREEALAGNAARLKAGVWSEEENAYKAWLRKVEDAQKRGEQVYAIRHRPGIPLSGGTVWVYQRTGELKRQCAVLAGVLVNGVQLDEDLAVYFVNGRPKADNDKPFLYGKGGILGAGTRISPFTGTLIKTKRDQECRVLLASAKVKLEPQPDRAPDLLALSFMEDAYMGKGSWCWVEGAEWIYAGAGPMSPVGCSCPRQHLGLDWYKRSYVPEGYRRSIGILDTAGNLIMHLGRYGNFDDAPGGPSGAKAGGEDIGMMLVRFVSATDNFLVYGDWDEKLVALKLDYHAEETAPVRTE